jgi:hypothetical protein
VRQTPVHPAGGENIEVSKKDTWFFFYRRQGVSIAVSPRRNWWCLWLCSSSTSIDSIEASISLRGLDETARAQARCSRCGSLDVMGPWFTGINVPKAFSRASYSGTVGIAGTSFEFAGEVLF